MFELLKHVASFVESSKKSGKALQGEEIRRMAIRLNDVCWLCFRVLYTRCISELGKNPSNVQVYCSLLDNILRLFSFFREYDQSSKWGFGPAFLVRTLEFMLYSSRFIAPDDSARVAVWFAAVLDLILKSTSCSTRILVLCFHLIREMLKKDPTLRVRQNSEDIHSTDTLVLFLIKHVGQSLVLCSPRGTVATGNAQEEYAVCIYPCNVTAEQWCSLIETEGEPELDALRIVNKRDKKGSAEKDNSQVRHGYVFCISALIID